MEKYKQFLPKHNKKLEILHFNDVYNIEYKTIGSAARFKTAFDQYDSKNKLVIFSGDLFFPSMLSTLFEGEQMIFPFEKLNVDISCLGNHELDFGIQKAKELISKTSSPWIITNLLDKQNQNRPIAGLDPYYVLETQGFKIGFMGFADESWTDTFMPQINCEDLQYVDFNQSLKQTSRSLKEEFMCDLIISINHMRINDDLKMAEQCKSPHELDMIFGGHDHSYFRFLNPDSDVFIQKSGTDFECFSNITVLFDVEKQDADVFQGKLINQDFSDSKNEVQIFYSEKLKRLFISEKIIITEEFKEDIEILEHSSKYTKELDNQLDEIIGCSEVDLEARFSRVRTEETNLGNLLSDLMRSELQTDLALSNGGCLRANSIISKGPIKLRFISEILPMEDQVVKINISGKLFIEALENGFSRYPSYDGRWPNISGIKLKIDPERNPGERILKESIIKDDGSPFELDKIYSCAIKWYMTTGKDGYSSLLDSSIQYLPPLKDVSALTIQDIFINWLREWKKDSQYFQNLNERAKKINQDRFQLFNSNPENRCSISDSIKFCPKITNRIQNIREPFIHHD